MHKAELLRLALAAYLGAELESTEVFELDGTLREVDEDGEGVLAHIAGLGVLVLIPTVGESDEDPE